MIWSQRQISALLKAVSTARRQIENKVAAQAVPVGSTKLWGQFLDQDRDENQVGIYGTCAAVEILLRQGYSRDDPIVANAESSLELARRSDPTGPFPIEDVKNTFKVAFLLESYEPQATEVADFGTLETVLMSQVATRSGWGNYADDDTPRLMPTCHVLIGLRRSARFKGSPERRRVVAWLSNLATDDQSLGVLDTSMALLALHCSLTTDTQVETSRQRAISTLSRRLTSAVASDRSLKRLDSESVHYAMKEFGAIKHHYMFYLRAAIVARALLVAPEARDKSLATDVAQSVCANIKSNLAFKSPTTHRISTVDQLEVIRFFDELQHKANESPLALFSAPAQILGGTRRRRLLVTAALMMAALLGAYLTIGGFGSAAQILGIVASGLFLGLLATAIWAWTGGRG